MLSSDTQPDTLLRTVQVLSIEPTEPNAKFVLEGSITFAEGPSGITTLMLEGDRVAIFLSQLILHDKKRYPSVIWNYRTEQYVLGPISKYGGFKGSEVCPSATTLHI